MVRWVRRISKKSGLPPGTMVHVGEEKAAGVRVKIIHYEGEQFEEREESRAEDCFPYRDQAGVTWIDIDGIHQLEIVEKIGQHFGLHPLTLEDVVNTNQRPKLEDYDDYIFLILKMLSYDSAESRLKVETVSLILGPNHVISVQEAPGDVFDPVRDRLRKGKGRIRRMGPDYLAYALMDAVVDNYFVVLEKIGEEIESLEEELMANPDTGTLEWIHALKRELIFLRKSVWPLREVIGALERGETDLVQERTLFFLRDVYDHTIQVIDTIETFRDMVAGMLDIYLSSLSNRMNEVMKVLTIIATIFIPLTFIAGIYGMNFENMPELKWPWGYPLIWGLMAAVSVGMLCFFRKKKWI